MDHTPPHPLTLALIERLEGASPGPVLEIGAGSGRNRRALQAAGFFVRSHEPAELRTVGGVYTGALSTHALLHGTRDAIAAAIDCICGLLAPGAPLLFTLGSKTDARFGQGEQVAPDTYAPLEGDEAGVSHTYFDKEGCRTMLDGLHIESLRVHRVDMIAGKWAHTQTPLHGAVHWFVIARTRTNA